MVTVLIYFSCLKCRFRFIYDSLSWTEEGRMYIDNDFISTRIPEVSG